MGICNTSQKSNHIQKVVKSENINKDNNLKSSKQTSINVKENIIEEEIPFKDFEEWQGIYYINLRRPL